MQEKRNLILLISLVVQISLCVTLLFFANRGNTLAIDKGLFKVPAQAEVDKVLLTNSNKPLELVYGGSKWMVNKSFEADRQLVTIFFAALMQTEPKRPVGETVKDSLREHILRKGTNVKLYEGETLVKDFWVSGNDAKTETYFLLQGDEVPYLVTIPGYRLYIASLFELSDNEWRDKRIFNFRWENFKSLTATFPGETKENFTISFQNKYFGIEGLTQSDTTKLNDYLDAVSLIKGSRFLSSGESPVYDSLAKTTPEFSIVVTDIANRTYEIEVFTALSSTKEILGRLNRETLVVFDLHEIGLIARKRHYFER
jgi:hypothetical protein